MPLTNTLGRYLLKFLNKLNSSEGNSTRNLTNTYVQLHFAHFGSNTSILGRKLEAENRAAFFTKLCDIFSRLMLRVQFEITFYVNVNLGLSKFSKQNVDI